MSKKKKLPDKINEKLLIMGQAGMEVFELIKQYNALPVGDPQRKTIYEKIKDNVQYEIDWD